MAMGISQLTENLKRIIKGKKSLLLFTGDKGSSLLMDIVKDMDVNIAFINTGYHFNEIMDYVKIYPLKIDFIQNKYASAEPAIDSDKCCKERKADALKEYLESVASQYLIVPFRDEEKDNGIEDSYIKGIDIEIIRPLADLKEQDIWINIKENKLRFSAIYNKSYNIVDCRFCTTRHGWKRQGKIFKTEGLEKETEEKLKALGYM